MLASSLAKGTPSLEHWFPSRSQPFSFGRQWLPSTFRRRKSWRAPLWLQRHASRPSRKPLEGAAISHSDGASCEEILEQGLGNDTHATDWTAALPTKSLFEPLEQNACFPQISIVCCIAADVCFSNRAVWSSSNSLDVDRIHLGHASLRNLMARILDEPLQAWVGLVAETPGSPARDMRRDYPSLPIGTVVVSARSGHRHRART